MKISFGALADPLHAQLDVPLSVLEHEQKLAEALMVCYFGDIITESELNKARKRLVKRIQTVIKEYHDAKN